MKRIYFDNAATTPLNKGVLRAIRPFLTKEYGNPSSNHKEGREVRQAIEKARLQVSKALNCKPQEIFFTSGASESNSIIVHSSPFLITLKNNHDSLELGANVVNDNEARVGWFGFSGVNSETGINYMKVGKAASFDFQWVHADLTQMIGKQKVDLKNLYWITSASFSGHKFGALKGVGVLFVREDKQKFVKPLIYGHQEQGLRGGTENVVGIVSLGEAIEIATKNMVKNAKRVSKIEDFLKKRINGMGLLCRGENGILSITFDNVFASTIMHFLDMRGVAVSVGSACNSDLEKPSNVLMQSGYTEDEALRTIRVSIGAQNTLREARKFCKILQEIVDKFDYL